MHSLLYIAKFRVKHGHFPDDMPLPNDVRPDDLAAYLRSLPKAWPGNLVRIGAEADGGYLVPDDLEGIRYCYSPGVEDRASFEDHLLREYGIQSFLADASVDGPPSGFTAASFTRRFLGPVTRDEFITLADWVEGTLPADAHNEDLLLQMDIESAEYEVLVSTPVETLAKFRIIVIEMHRLLYLNRRRWFGKFRAVMDKLTRNFTIVHLHPNNHSRVTKIGEITMPGLIEMTFIRNDRLPFLTTGAGRFPHPLDRPCHPGKPDVPLPAAWQSIG